MQMRDRIAFGTVLGVLCLTPTLTSCTASEEQVQQTVEEIENATELNKEDVKATVATLETRVDRVVAEAENLSTRELQVEAIQQDLAEIQNRLSAAVDLPEEELKAELQQSADRLDNLIARVEEAAENATGEAKTQLEAYGADLKELREETVRAIEEANRS